MANHQYIVRQLLDQDSVDAFYVGFPHLFSIKMHHGGTFTRFPRRKYETLTVDIIDMLDIDKFSVHELDGILTQLGYDHKAKRYYHYLVPNADLDFGLGALGSDLDVIGFAKYVSEHKLMNVYVEHEFTTVHTYFCSPSKVIIKEISDEEIAAIDMNVKARNRLMLGWQDSGSRNETGDSSRQQETFDVSMDDPGFDPFFGQNVEHDPGFDPFFGQNVEHEPFHNEFNFTDNVNWEEHVGEQQGDDHVHDVDANAGDDDVDDVDDNAGDDEVDDNADDEVDDNADDDVHDLADNAGDEDEDEDSDFIVDEGNPMDDVEVDMKDFRLHTDTDVENHMDDHLDKLAMEEDVLDNDVFDGADEEGSSRRKRNSNEKGKAIENNDLFSVGQVFGTKEEVKKLIREHAVETRRQIKIVKDDLERARAVCKGDSVYGSHPTAPTKPKGPLKPKGPVMKEVGSSSKTCGDKVLKHVGGRGKKKDPNSHKCPWVVLVSPKEDSWVVKTFIGEHKCLQSRQIYACTASFLSKELFEQLQENPKIPVRAVQEQFQRRYEIGISQMKAYRARAIAMDQIHGDFNSQYGLIRDYAEELVRTNPGTTIKIEVQPVIDRSSNKRICKRMYVCLGSLKEGFKALGRDLIGLDGAFLKGPYPGQLLTAVGLDPNNGIYPVAYAVVESETFSSWSWFLACLGDDLDLFVKKRFTFISDRQKGVIPAVEELFPTAHHRFCLRHIHENMKLKFKGKIYQDALWKLASHTTVAHFDKDMESLKKFNSAAHLWLSGIPPKHWARSHFTGDALSDVLLNNMCEVLNSKLVEGRDKPIITMLEYIREYLMRRIVHVLKVIDKSDGMLTPYASKIMETTKKDALRYIVKWNGDSHYGVSGTNPNSDKYVVNMSAKTCACRKWEITGIPCRHAVAVIWTMSAHGEASAVPEMYVNPVYTMERWKSVYSYKIYPLNGMSMWPKSTVPSVLVAPKYHKPIGRPKKARRKSAVEIEEGRKGKRVKGVSKEASTSKGKSKVAEGSTSKGKQSGQGGKSKEGSTCGRCKQTGHNKRTRTK